MVFKYAKHKEQIKTKVIKLQTWLSCAFLESFYTLLPMVQTNKKILQQMRKLYDNKNLAAI